MNKQELSVDCTINFAKGTYGDTLTVTDTVTYTHCVSVARLAEQISQKLFNDMRGDAVPPDSHEIVAAIVHASLLSETINTCRSTFEVIADVTNVQIATMVSTLSRDLRLVETKRDIEYRGRLSVSPLATQIVAVAAIICTAQETVRLLQPGTIAAIPKSRKILAQLDGDLLCIHAAAKYYTLRLYAHAARNLIGDANQIIKKLKEDARMARNVAKMTTGIRSRQAAKNIAVKQEKEEPQRGRKRNKRNSG